MVNQGFEETAKKVDVNARFNAVDKRFDKVEERLDRIENILLRAHDNRLDRLEDAVRVIKTKVGIH